MSHLPHTHAPHTPIPAHPEDAKFTRTERRLFANPSREAFWLLRAVFVLAPLIAGLDKFFNILTDWQAYLSAPAKEFLAGSTGLMMSVIGILEIAIAIGVALKPKIFGYVIALWLIAIVILNLLPGGLYALALRDFGLAIAAVALSLLALHHEQQRDGE